MQLLRILRAMSRTGENGADDGRASCSFTRIVQLPAHFKGLLLVLHELAARRTLRVQSKLLASSTDLVLAGRSLGEGRPSSATPGGPPDSLRDRFMCVQKGGVTRLAERLAR